MRKILSMGQHLKLALRFFSLNPFNDVSFNRNTSSNSTEYSVGTFGELQTISPDCPRAGDFQ